MDSKMRWFIFFYRCENQRCNMYGQYGNWSEKLLSNTFVSEQVALNHDEFTAGQVSILSFNEVSESDYNNFFDKK